MIHMFQVSASRHFLGIVQCCHCSVVAESHRQCISKMSMTEGEGGGRACDGDTCTPT